MSADTRTGKGYRVRLVVLGVMAFLTLGGAATAGSGALALLHQQQQIARQAAAQRSQESTQQRTEPTRQPHGQIQLQPLPSVPQVPDIDRIGLERTMCLGTCPAYTVVIMADGSFTYTGTAHVERMGTHRGSVPRWFLDRVLRYVDEIDFMSIDPTFDEFVLDAPSTYTMVERSGTTHVVLNAANAAPSIVWALERLIDDMLELATWE